MSVQKPSKHGRDHVGGAEDPIPSLAMWPIKVFRDDMVGKTGDGRFIWLIPEDLDGHTLMKVEAFNTTPGSGATTIQVRKVGVADMLSTPITIDSGESNSKDAGTQPVVNPTYATVAWGDHISFDFDAVGAGAKGTGVYCYFLAGPDVVQTVRGPTGSAGAQGPQGDPGADGADGADGATGAQGPQGDPGGITAWLGEWDSATTYAESDAVSLGGSSYVARQGNTDVEPGVDTGWEDYWQVLASGVDINPTTDGWTVEATDTWVYVSATSFKITGTDVTARFPKGTRVRFKQGAGYKYMVVTGASFSTDTTVTVTGGSDYSVANATITDAGYSYQVSPQGYPAIFNWTPTIKTDNSNFALNNGTLTGTFSIVGQLVTVHLSLTWGSSTASGTGKFYIDAVPAGSLSASTWGVAFGNDSGTSFWAGHVVYISGRVCATTGTSGSLQWRNDQPFTWGNGDNLLWDFSYYI